MSSTEALKEAERYAEAHYHFRRPDELRRWNAGQDISQMTPWAPAHVFDEVAR